MQTTSDPVRARAPFRVPVWLGFCLFLAIALFFLWEEHKAHIFGAVPYVLLLLCPILHLLTHRGHRGHGTRRSGHGGQAHDRHDGGL
jgi:Protein of unknown function (DUF2933)